MFYCKSTLMNVVRNKKLGHVVLVPLNQTETKLRKQSNDSDGNTLFGVCTL